MVEPLRVESTESRWSSSDVLDVVRVHDEPWVHVDDLEVHDRLTADPAGYIAHLRARLAALASGALPLDLPPKRIFTDAQGDFRVMPCVTGSGPSAVKTVKVVGTNLEQRRVPDQITVGKALRLDPEENFVTHVFDACLLSSARTGACGTIALELLAPDVRRVAVVGAGRVGTYTGIYLDAVLPDIELAVVDRRPERARRVARALAAGGVRCIAGDADAVRDAEAVVIATSSREPILAPHETTARSVVSVGADSEDQHELAVEWAREAKLFVDSDDAADVGDVRSWLAAGALAAVPPTLLDLIRSGAATDGRRVFVSTGSALFDNLTIDYLLAEEPARAPDARG